MPTGNTGWQKENESVQRGLSTMKSNFNELNLNDMKKVNAGYRHQGTHIGPSIRL